MYCMPIKWHCLISNTVISFYLFYMYVGRLLINFLLFLLLFQVSFDLGTLYFYQEKFLQAMKLFESCKNAEVCHKHLLLTGQ